MNDIEYVIIFDKKNELPCFIVIGAPENKLI